MYYMLHIMLAFLYVIPALFTDSYTQTDGFLKIIIYSMSGIILGLIHFMINYYYKNKSELTSNRMFFTPLFTMGFFLIAYNINYASNHFPYEHIKHYGVYLFVSFTIIWSFISYIIISKKMNSCVKYKFKKTTFKKTASKLITLVISLFVVCCSTEVIKNEILTFKYGGQFENLTCIKENVGTYESFKVVDYSEYEAYLYYITDYEPNPIGFIVRLEYYRGRWNYRSDCVVWSTMGSADDAIWPYWWHWFTK